MTRSARRNGRPIDVPGISTIALRSGYYSDAYFLNAARILAAGARAGERFRGRPLAARAGGARLGSFVPGDAEVEMQFFARRGPRFLAAGVDLALGMLRDGVRGGRGVNRLRVEAVPEGTLTRPLEPVLTVRGRYRAFAHLETPLLGLLARCSRLASNVYESLVASRGKPILFFPARFDLPQCQPLDGYAYRIAVEAYRRITGTRVPAHVATDAQGSLWQERGRGTVPHAFILCFLGDTTEAMLAFCRHAPTSVMRVALVDTTNDCVGESVRTARRLFEEYRRLLRAGRPAEAARYVLHAVRVDTAQDLRDRSVPASRDARRQRGVTPALVRLVRHALDGASRGAAAAGGSQEIADRYFRGVRIVASGGFDPGKIRFFERNGAPVDIYGIGSYLLRGAANDYTADVVRVRLGRHFMTVAKTGRGPHRNADLKPVRLH